VSAARFIQTIQGKVRFEWLLLLVFVISLILRFYLLDLKLFHHDEAIHAWFSYRLLTGGGYLYDPVFHGPFLYYTTAAMFRVFGDSDLIGRVLPALLGALLIPFIYLIHRLGYLDKRQTFVAALFVAVSPDMVYFSRFLRNDIFILFFTLLLLVALLYYLEYGKFRYALIAGLAAGLGMSSKENMPFVLVIFGSYLLFLLWRRRITLPPAWRRDILAAAFIAIGLMALLYSSFGAHPEVLADGWLRAIEHWTAMHGQQRLPGPWFSYILLLLLYELPIFILACLGVVQYVILRRRGFRPLSYLRSKIGSGVQGMPVHDLVVRCNEQLRARFAFTPRDKREEFASFCICWMLFSLAIYAYLGEKVPWLLLHQLLPMIFVAVYRMTTKKMIIAVIASLFLIACTWHVAFVPVDVNEPIVQVQNSEEFRDVLALIDASDHVAVASEKCWPLPWYCRGSPPGKLVYYGKKVSESTLASGDFDLVIAHDQESYPELEGFSKRTCRLSYWFSYYDNRDRLMEYYFLRDGRSGSVNIDLFIRST